MAAEERRVHSSDGAGKKFTPDDIYPAVVVYDRGGTALTAADQALAAADARRFTAVTGVDRPIVGPIRAKDGQALELVVPIAVGRGGVSDTLPAVRAIRSMVRSEPIHVQITGAAGYGADSADAFSGIDTALP